MGFSLGFAGIKTLNYWILHVDSLLVGYILGSTSLGIYNRAFALSRMPVRSFAQVLGRVFFPALSTIQDDRQKCRRIFVRLNVNVGFIVIPFMLGLFLISDEFVLVFLRSEWVEMIPIIKVFAVVGILSTFCVINNSIFFALGKSTLLFRISLACQLLVVICILLGIQFGLLGVAYGLLIGNAVFAVAVLVVGAALIDQSIFELLGKMKTLIVVNVVLFSSLYAAKLFFHDFTSNFVRLILIVPIVVISYVAISHFLRLQPYIEVKQLLDQKLPRIRKKQVN